MMIDSVSATLENSSNFPIQICQKCMTIMKIIKNIRLFNLKKNCKPDQGCEDVVGPKIYLPVLVSKTMSVDLHFRGLHLAQPISTLPLFVSSRDILWLT
jgi:hypothetical protein